MRNTTHPSFATKWIALAVTTSLIHLLICGAACPPCILFSNTTDLIVLDPATSTFHSVISGLSRAVAVDVHYTQGLVFWSDVWDKTIRRANIDGSNISAIINVLGMCDGLAVEWMSNLLYWTDLTHDTIEVAHLDGSNRRILISLGLDKPRGLTVDPRRGYMFWTDWGQRPKIERATLNGEGRTSIATSSLHWPNDITIDFLTNKLFWADAYLDKIETADYDGSNRRQLFYYHNRHPFAVTLLCTTLYWTDWRNVNGLVKIAKNNGAYLGSYQFQGRPMGLAMYDSSRQPTGSNACSTNKGGCSHICLLKPGGHICACPTGVALNSDGKTCREKVSKFFLFTDGSTQTTNLISLDVSYFSSKVLFYHLNHRSIAIGYDPVDDKVYWTDNAHGFVASAYRNATNFKRLIICNIGIADGLAIDWLSRNIYWTDTASNRIEVSKLEGSARKSLVTQGLDEPRDIILDLERGTMYWADWGNNPKIETANMDGTSRRAIVTSGLWWPNGLAINSASGRIYWADAKLDKIEESDLTGANRRVILSGSAMHPYGLEFYKGYLYWTDWLNKTVSRISVVGGVAEVLLVGLQMPMDIHVYNADTRPAISSPCTIKNGGCTDLCLLIPGGHQCACPTGVILKADGKSCDHDLFERQASDNVLLMSAAVDQVIYRVPLQVKETPCEPLPINENISRPIALGYDPQGARIYWTDVTLHTISRAYLNGSSVEVIAKSNVKTPDGLTLDVVARNIYWTDTGTNRIEVARLDGSSRRGLVTSGLDEPRAIVVYPSRGIMFWTDWGSTPKIEKANMDGSGRTTILLAGLGFPNGLTIDYDQNLLFWVDAKTKKIECADFSGNNRKVILDLSSGNHFPFSLVLHKQSLYWTDWGTKSLYHYNRTSMKNSTIVIGVSKPMGLVMYDSKSSQQGMNGCSNINGDCSNLCLANSLGYQCACPDGVFLKPSDSKTCEGVNRCPRLQTPAHGSMHACSTLTGQTCQFSCSKGYELLGSRLRTCQSNGQWTGSQTSCQVIRCPSLNTPPNSMLLTPSCGNVFGSQCQLKCKPGYVVGQGSTLRICLESGEWSGTTISCTDSTPPSFGDTCPSNFTVYTPKGQFSVVANWSEPTPSDNSGLLPTVKSNIKAPPVNLSEGDHVILYTAQDSAGNRGFCSFKISVDVIKCKVLTVPSSGPLQISSCGDYYGTQCSFSCRSGYRLIGEKTMTCLASNDKPPGTWNTAMPRCEEIRCFALPTPPNAKKTGCINNSTEPYMAACHFTCNVGFVEVAGSSVRRCLKNGSWTGEILKCNAITCEGLKSPNNARISPASCTTKSPFGTTCTFTCSIGFILSGTYGRTCGDKGKWSGANDTACNDTRLPSFGNTCPTSFVLYTEKCSLNKTVSWIEPVATDNSGTVHVRYPHIRPPVVLGVGRHAVTYSAIDDSGNRMDCNFIVQIQERICPRLPTPAGGAIKSSSCGNLYGSGVILSCNKGKRLSGSSKRTCLLNGQWSGNETSCKDVTCQKVNRLANGRTYPSMCTNKSRVSYGTICFFMCNVSHGYGNQGPRNVTCEETGLWNPSPGNAVCKDVQAPQMNCPKNMLVSTEAGKAFAIVTWKVPEPTDNSGKRPELTVKPGEIKSSTHKFDVGKTLIKYTAKDSAGLSSSCTFSVTVKDTEAPRVVNCPEPEIIISKNKATTVYLPDVKFSDNVGVHHVAISIKNGSELTWGDFNITYTASDKAGNQATCEWSLGIVSSACENLEPPLNGGKACETWLVGVHCTIHCNPGYGFSQTPDKLYFCSPNGKWSHAKGRDSAPLPDCSKQYDPSEARVVGEVHYLTATCELNMNEVRKRFIAIFKSHPFGLTGGCQGNNNCRMENVQVECDEVKRKRREIGSNFIKLKVKFQLTVVIDSNNSFNNTSEELIRSMEDTINNTYYDLEIGEIKIRLNRSSPLLVHTISPSCKVGRVPRGDKCVNCPLGTIYNARNEICSECPADQYQDTEAQTECVSCPQKTSTYGKTRQKRAADCKEYSSASNDKSKVMIIALPVAALSLIVIIIVVMILYCKCFRSNRIGGSGQEVFENELCGEDDITSNRSGGADDITIPEAGYSKKAYNSDEMKHDESAF